MIDDDDPFGPIEAEEDGGDGYGDLGPPAPDDGAELWPATLPLGADLGRGFGGREADEGLLARLAYLHQNDVGNAHRLIARFGGDLVYVKGLGWLAWVGDHWDAETGEHTAKLHAQATGRMIRAEAGFLEKHAALPAADREKLVASRKAFATDCGNSGRVNSMLAMAAPHLARPVDDLDAMRDRLTVANGTVTFLPPPLGPDGRPAEGVEPEELFRFRPLHDRDDLSTHISRAHFRPDAVCPKWMAYLAKVQPDPAVRAFLARLVGYCLTGLTSEECLVAFEGKGANGKSLFLDVIERMLGSAAVTIDFATLLADDRRSGSNASPDLARLRGVRLAVAGEPERGAKLAEGRIKAITGGDAIVARKLREDLVEYKPMFKLLLSWNTRPRVGGDDGIWRRILVLPWTVQILPRLANGQPNPEWRRKEDMLAEFDGELDGILLWALRGYADWRMGGLRPPAAVLDAVKSYREQSDPVGTFIDECCELADPMARTLSSSLYACFRDWSHGQGWQAMSQKAFGESLTERGFRKAKSAGQILREGVTIASEWQVGGPARVAAKGDDAPPADAYEGVE